MKIYSLDLRERALAAVDRGTPRREAVGVFGVSLATTLKRWLKRRRESGSAAPKRKPGMRRRVGADAEGRTQRHQLEENPEATLEEHREVWELERGARQRRHDEPGYPPPGVDLQAKTVGACERDDEARARWRERVARLVPGRLVSVDESGSNVGLERRARTSGSNVGLAPLRARAPRGERALGKAPRNRGKNTTLLASIVLEGMGPCAAMEGATTARVFEAYVEQVLLPALRPGRIVVLDNLSAHKGERVKEMVQARGCEVLFLPAYSPDFADRGGVQQAQGAASEGEGPHEGGPPRGDREGLGRDRRAGREVLVCPLRIHTWGSLTLRVAVGERRNHQQAVGAPGWSQRRDR